MLTAVRRRVAIKDIPTAFKPALDNVWGFLSKHPGLRTEGHNIFLYHHEGPAIMTVDFGVEVVWRFEGDGDVACVTTPVGQTAVASTAGPTQSFLPHTRRCLSGVPRTLSDTTV
jgi:hypothetical protein